MRVLDYQKHKDKEKERLNERLGSVIANVAKSSQEDV